MLPSQQKEDIARNRYIVREIIDVLIICSRQNIAIRGRGIPKKKVIPWQFHFMCPITTKYYSNTWITQYLINSRIILTPPDIQNKIIEISGKMVGEKVVRTCNYFEYFGLIGDDATDVSAHEQVCVRFVECTGDKVILRDNFLALCKRNYR